MKKFSNFNEKVETKEDSLKVSILSLIDKCLTIRSNGAAHRELLNNSITIDGKEMLANAIINLISNESSKEQIKTLESLKSEMKDWETIDNKIQVITDTKENKSKFLLENLNILNNIKKFINIYSKNENFNDILDIYSNRIEDKKQALLRHKTAILMMEDNEYSSIKDSLKLVSEKFLQRSKEL